MQDRNAEHLARGEENASRGPAKSIVPDSSTMRPGRNFRLFGFGVSWVCMNMFLTGRKANKVRVNQMMILDLIALLENTSGKLLTK